RDRVPVKFLAVLSAGAPHLRAQLWSGQQKLQKGIQLFLRIGLEPRHSVQDSFGLVRVPRDDRQPTGGSFDNNLRRAFENRWEKEDVRLPILFPQLLRLQSTEETHVAQTVASDSAGDLVLQRAFADDPEIGFREASRG